MNQILAALGLAICAALLVHMVLPAQARARIDAAWLRLRGALQALVRRRPRRRPPRPTEPLTQRDAERLARDAIDRARRTDWQGNVARPEAFGHPLPREREPGAKP